MIYLDTLTYLFISSQWNEINPTISDGGFYPLQVLSPRHCLVWRVWLSCVIILWTPILSCLRHRTQKVSSPDHTLLKIPKQTRYELNLCSPLSLSRLNFLASPPWKVEPGEEVFDWVWNPGHHLLRHRNPSKIEYDRLPKPHQTPTTNSKHAPNIENHTY